MILLKRGQQGPSVVVLQVLLKAVGGATIKVDGIFGPNTERAVRAFQTSQPGLGRDGIVGKSTWPPLARKAGVYIADVVDMEDPSTAAQEATDIRAAGGNPVILRGMSNGVGQAVVDIQRQYPSGSIAILRFHSHGEAGDMNVSAGTGGDSAADLSGISHDNIATVRPLLRNLGRHLISCACIEFHGCSVGHGVLGKKLLQGVADAAERPASAGIQTQYSGGGYSTFRFEGPVASAYSGSITMKQWALKHQVLQSGPIGTRVSR
jgi:hypothetical protein